MKTDMVLWIQDLASKVAKSGHTCGMELVRAFEQIRKDDAIIEENGT